MNQIFYQKHNNPHNNRPSDHNQKDIKKNPFIPSVKPSDIIEKSTKISGDWLTRDIKKRLPYSKEDHD
jgi:hypothetical protein